MILVVDTYVAVGQCDMLRIILFDEDKWSGAPRQTRFLEHAVDAGMRQWRVQLSPMEFRLGPR